MQPLWGARYGRRRIGPLALLAILGLLLPGKARAVSGDILADVVLGQPTFTSDAANAGGLGAATLKGPIGIAVTPIGRLYVADAGNNRVLSWPSTTAIANGQAADLVIGQPDFTTNDPNHGGIGAAGLNHPTFVAVDAAGNLWVADTLNNRVLAFDDPTTHDAVADLVVGQPDFISVLPNYGGLGPTGLSIPYGVGVDPTGNLWVADYGNNRVLGYEMPMVTDTTADRVLGQPGFTTNDPNHGGRDETTLASPLGVSTDKDANVYVADFENHRVLKFNMPIASNRKADRVWGQPDFAHGAVNNGGLSANSLFHPEHAVLTPSGTLFVADRGNNRVLEYQNALTASRNAERAFGQPTLVEGVANNGGLGAQSLSTPLSVAVDARGNLWVADFENNRVLRYDPPVVTPPAENRAPTLAGGPAAAPAAAGVGQAVALSVAATDEDGDPLAYSWDFGDGEGSAGAAVTHVYATAGTFTARVTVSDGRAGTAEGSVEVTVRAPLVGNGADSDGDGFADAFEIAVGTSALDAASTPLGGQPVDHLEPLTVSNLSIMLRFRKAGRDAITLRGSLPVDGMTLRGTNPLVDVGGVIKLFSLGSRLTGVAKGGRLTLKRKAGSTTYAVSLKPGSFASTLAELGLGPSVEAPTVARHVPVFMLFGGRVYAVDAGVTYTIRGAGRSGRARTPR